MKLSVFFWGFFCFLFLCKSLFLPSSFSFLLFDITFINYILTLIPSPPIISTPLLLYIFLSAVYLVLFLAPLFFSHYPMFSCYPFLMLQGKTLFLALHLIYISLGSLPNSLDYSLESYNLVSYRIKMIIIEDQSSLSEADVPQFIPLLLPHNTSKVAL